LTMSEIKRQRQEIIARIAREKKKRVFQRKIFLHASIDAVCVLLVILIWRYLPRLSRMQDHLMTISYGSMMIPLPYLGVFLIGLLCLAFAGSGMRMIWLIRKMKKEGY